MCEVAAEAVSNAPERLLRLVLERERVLPSGLEDELAVPNARVNGLTRPLVVVAKSEGIDFNARDGKPARLIIMILTEITSRNMICWGCQRVIQQQGSGGASGEREKLSGIGSGSKRAGAVGGRGRAEVPANCTGWLADSG